MKRVITVATVALLFVGGVGLGNEKKPASFGALESMSADQAKAKFAAWLKDIGKADAANLAKLETIWKDDQRSMLDRTADSLAIGDKNAAQMIAEARDPKAPAPIILPAAFKDEKASVFFRANLGLVYARSLTNRRVYEEALDTLNLFTASQVVDPSAYLFHRAVCEHALLRKPEAVKTIVRLLEEGHSISPERYKTVAALMLLDMHTWKDKDLGDIARKMDNIERRLDIARGGPETRRQQREVLNRLDEMIKKLENADKKKKKDGPPKDGPPGDGPPSDGPPECPDGGKPGPGDGPPKNVDPSQNPAQKPGDVNTPTTGNLNQAAFKKLVADWGRLPPREQQKALQDLTQGMSPRHREAIENYFRNLNNPAFNRK
ncbi:MAG: hypothetical protein HY289_15200 [Planctomycetes bacterium]|nr:hypothetical protein [Planctomycetota bacterium]